MMAEEPVWITGVGLATSLGCDLATLEANLLAGRSGVAVVTSFCTTDYPSRIAAELPAVPCPSGREPRAFHALPRLEQAALWCVQAALEDAGLWNCRATRRIGLVLGIGAEWMGLWEADASRGGAIAGRPLTPVARRDRRQACDADRRLGLPKPIA